jgi:PAS domain S-box-containing protein
MRNTDERVREILRILLKYIQKDFSENIPVSDAADDLDAIATGLNTMAEEMDSYVTEVQRMKTELEEKVVAKESEYQALIEQATDGIFISDKTGKYIDANFSGCAMLGYTKSELLTLSIHDMLISDDARRNPPRLEELKAGKSILATRTLKRKDGTTFPAEINSKMLSNGNLLGMVRDITARVHNEELLKANEEKFRNLTETAFDAIVLTDSKGKVIFWNKGAELMFGYKKEEALQTFPFLLMPGKNQGSEIHSLQSYLTEEKNFRGKVIELEGRRKNGETFPIEIAIASWESAGEKIFSGIIRDVSERKQAEEKILRLNEDLERKISKRTSELNAKMRQLKESEEKFQKAFQASAAGISITRLSDGKYLDVNDAFLRMTGYSREEVIEHSSTELGLILNTKQREDILRQMQEHGSVKNFEMVIQNRHDEQLNILSSIETISLNEQKYAINIIYDITQRKKAEEQLKSTNRELEAFSYSISHDLRAPLRSIIGYSKILEEDFGALLNEEGKKTLTVIQRNALRMNDLIDGLLQFSRLGRKELEKTLVNTEQIVHNIITILNNNSSSHKTEINVKNLPPVQADPMLLAQVWENLLSNAIKYSSKNANPKIEVGAKKNPGEIEYYVKDNGAGFDMAFASKLFEVFQRLHKPEQFEGTGIGLSIVKRIIGKHGGRVWAEGKVNQGATFFFTLPDTADVPAFPE